MGQQPFRKAKRRPERFPFLSPLGRTAQPVPDRLLGGARRDLTVSELGISARMCGILSAPRTAFPLHAPAGAEGILGGFLEVFGYKHL